MTYLSLTEVRYWAGIDDLRTIRKKRRFGARTTEFEVDYLFLLCIGQFDSISSTIFSLTEEGVLEICCKLPTKWFIKKLLRREKCNL